MAKYRAPKTIREKTAKKEFQKNLLKFFLLRGGIFLFAGLIATYSAFKLNKSFEILPKSLPQDILIFILFSAAMSLFFWIDKNKKLSKLKDKIYKGIFSALVFCGGVIFLNLFLPIFGAVIIVGVLIIIWFRIKIIWLRNLLLILGIGGMAGFFGLNFGPSVILALLLLFSVFDFIAIYKDRRFALSERESGLYFYFADLGAGAVFLPNALAAAAVSASLVGAIVVILFSLAGLFFGCWIFLNQKLYKEKDPAPALPPIALFSIIGYLVALFI